MRQKRVHKTTTAPDNGFPPPSGDRPVTPRIARMRPQSGIPPAPPNSRAVPAPAPPSLALADSGSQHAGSFRRMTYTSRGVPAPAPPALALPDNFGSGRRESCDLDGTDMHPPTTAPMSPQHKMMSPKVMSPSGLRPYSARVPPQRPPSAVATGPLPLTARDFAEDNAEDYAEEDVEYLAELAELAPTHALAMAVAQRGGAEKWWREYSCTWKRDHGLSTHVRRAKSARQKQRKSMLVQIGATRRNSGTRAQHQHMAPPADLTWAKVAGPRLGAGKGGPGGVGPRLQHVGGTATQTLAR